MYHYNLLYRLVLECGVYYEVQTTTIIRCPRGDSFESYNETCEFQVNRVWMVFFMIVIKITDE